MQPNNLIKCEDQLNLKDLFAVIMFMCDMEREDKICNSKKYESMRSKSDRLVLLRHIKQLMYTTGDDDLHSCYKQAMAVWSY